MVLISLSGGDAGLISTYSCRKVGLLKKLKHSSVSGCSIGLIYLGCMWSGWYSIKDIAILFASNQLFLLCLTLKFRTILNIQVAFFSPRICLSVIVKLNLTVLALVSSKCTDHVAVQGRQLFAPILLHFW